MGFGIRVVKAGPFAADLRLRRPGCPLVGVSGEGAALPGLLWWSVGGWVGPVPWSVGCGIWSVPLSRVPVQLSFA